MGVRYGFQPSPETVLYARSLLPGGAIFTAIGVGRHVFTAATQSYLAGGNVRVGIEDGVYLSRGVLAPSNAAMVTKIRGVVEALGAEIATPSQVRDLLGLRHRGGRLKLPSRKGDIAMTTATPVLARQRNFAVRVEAKASSPEALNASLKLVESDAPTSASDGAALVEVRSSGVNPSDVKAVMGAMPHALWPRTPGRDYAGVVVDGPKNLLGREVWGSGGELGIRRDGTHAAPSRAPGEDFAREAGRHHPRRSRRYRRPLHHRL